MKTLRILARRSSSGRTWNLKGRRRRKAAGFESENLKVRSNRKRNLPASCFQLRLQSRTSTSKAFVNGWTHHREIEESARRKTLPPSPESAFATVKERGQLTRPTLVDREVPPQNEMQEFSLSIGSISIVVEEPPAPKQQVNHVQPQTAVAVSPAPPAHDAFALSRRYFRGF